MDITLHFIDKGEGFPLILLHGNGENSSYFSSQIEYFSKTRRVIAPDTRGHGKSPRGDMPFTLSQFAEDLKNLLDSLNITKADILGFSDGGNIALLFALKYPQYVNRLILNGANLNPGGVKAFVQLPVVIGCAVCSVAALFSKNAKLKKEILLLMVNQPHIPAADLAALEMPVLVIVGDHDMIKPKHTQLITKSIKSVEYTELCGSHFIAKENSVEFNRSVDAFLTKTF